jgi:predicted adenine nucleotide alpha hydrolase (AANH) superfamily ATPase
VIGYQSFGGPYCFHLHGEVNGAGKEYVDRDHDLNHHRRGNFKSRNRKFLEYINMCHLLELFQMCVCVCVCSRARSRHKRKTRSNAGVYEGNDRRKTEIKKENEI